MMVESDHLLLEQPRPIRGEIGSLLNGMQTMRVEMTAIRQHMAAIMTIQEHDHADIAGIKDRLERIEKRLELAD
jgi:ACT domain-containing protein